MSWKNWNFSPPPPVCRQPSTDSVKFLRIIVRWRNRGFCTILAAWILKFTNTFIWRILYVQQIGWEFRVGDGLEEKIRMSPIPPQLGSRIFRTSFEDFFPKLATFVGFLHAHFHRYRRYFLTLIFTYECQKILTWHSSTRRGVMSWKNWNFSPPPQSVGSPLQTQSNFWG